MSEVYDVVVVGAGVAGAVLAKKLKNLHVLVLEKGRMHKIDSGIVSTRYDMLVGKRSFIDERLYEMKFVSPSGKTFSIRSEKPFAYRLKRKEFSKYLQSKIEKRIAHERVIAVEFSPDKVLVRTDSNTYACSVVVGCDGAHSVVRANAGIRSPKICYGLVSRHKSPEMKGRFNVYLNKYFSPDFFAWMLSDEYGLMTAIRPRACWDFFCKKMMLKQKQLSGAAIPIGYVKSYRDNCMLVGDSAGQTKPLTGGGIIFSMLCARHAADVIKTAFEQDYFKADLLSLYEKRWKREIGLEIRKQLFMRNIYRRLTNKQIDALFSKFGPHLEKINEFDYDKLSSIAYRMPKAKIMKMFFNTMAGM